MKRGNGEGSIYQRKDGRWVGSTYVLTPDGRRVRKDVYGKTRKEAHAKLTELIRRTQQNQPAVEDGRRLGAYLEAWLVEVARPKVRPSTYRSYETYVRNHLVPGLGGKRLNALRSSDVRAFLQGKRDEGLSARTVQYLHAILRAALEHAVREELLSRNVVKLVQPGPVERGEVVPLTAEEARSLLEAAHGDRLYALYAVALAVGLRRGEALGLAWADVDVVNGTLRVRQALQRVEGRLQFVAPKTQRSRRTVPLPRSASTRCGRTGGVRRPSGTKRGSGGRSTGWCSPRRSARRSSRGTSTATSTSCAGGPASAVSGCTTCGTPARPCCWPRACRLAW